MQAVFHGQFSKQQNKDSRFSVTRKNMSETSSHQFLFVLVTDVASDVRPRYIRRPPERPTFRFSPARLAFPGRKSQHLRNEIAQLCLQCSNSRPPRMQNFRQLQNRKHPVKSLFRPRGVLYRQIIFRRRFIHKNLWIHNGTLSTLCLTTVKQSAATVYANN